MFSKELKLLTLENRRAKLSLNLDAHNIVNKINRKIKKLKEV